MDLTKLHGLALGRLPGAGGDMANDINDNLKSNPDGAGLNTLGTDDAGNPILESPINALSNAKAAGLPDYSSASSANISDVSFMDVAKTALFGTNPDDPEANKKWEALRRYGLLANEMVAPEQKFLEDSLYNVRHPIDSFENFVKDGIAGSNNYGTQIAHSQLYENYFYRLDERNQEISRISNIVGISEDVLRKDRDVYIKAAQAAERIKRLEENKAFLDKDGKVDMNKVYQAIPGLEEVQKQYGTSAAALALGQLKGLQTINDIYHNEASRFAGSVLAGVQRGVYAGAKNLFYAWAALRGRRPDNTEQGVIDWGNKGLNNLPAYSFSGVGGTLGAAVGGAVENIPMIAEGQGAAYLSGMAAAGVTMALTRKPSLAAKIGKIASKAGSVIGMGVGIAGNQYEQNLDKLNADGQYMYTPKQAAALSYSQGIAEGVLEDYSLGQMGKALFGRGADVAIKDIVKKAGGFEAAKEGIRSYLVNRMEDFAKSGAVMMKNETWEEFTQQASDMILENIAQKAIYGDKADVSSINEILNQSVGAAIDAVPSIAGFGLVGVAARPAIVGSSKVRGIGEKIRNLPHAYADYIKRIPANTVGYVQAVQKNEMYRNMVEGQHLMNVVEGVQNNLANIEELRKASPEAATKILDVQNERAGVKDAWVDVKTLAQTEGGEKLVQDIAKADGKTPEELTICMANSGMLPVKTSTLMQLEGISGTVQQENLLKNITATSTGGTHNQVMNDIENYKSAMKYINNWQTENNGKSIENFVQSNFKDSPEKAAMARDILTKNYDNPAQELKTRLANVQAALDEYTAPVMRTLREGMGQGVSVVENGNRDGRGIRVSNNAPWYSKWFQDHGSVPTNDDIEKIALGYVTGEDLTYAPDSGASWAMSDPEMVKKMDEDKSAINKLLDERQMLREMAPNITGIQKWEMEATATLSPEARKVYDHMVQVLSQSKNKEVKRAAKLNALLLSRMADRVAKMHQEAGEKNYTAEDFTRSVNVTPDAVYSAEQAAAQGQLAQKPGINNSEIEKQKKFIKDAYFGTKQWLMAPNGVRSNLDEESWLIVRTPEFKKWFGDWEGKFALNELKKSLPETIHTEGLEKIKDVEIRRTIAENIFKKKYKDEKGNPIYIPNKYGENICIAKTGFKELSNHSADILSLLIVPDLETIIRKSTLLYGERTREYRLKKKNKSTLGYKVYGLKANISGHEYYIKSIVRIDLNGKYFYDGDATSIEEIKKADKFKLYPNSKSGQIKKSAFVKNSLSDWWQKVNSSIVSKVVDENGEPLVVYHGSAKDFDTFDAKYMYTGEGNTQTGSGFYFTTDKANAEHYASLKGEKGSVYPVFLNLHNPLYIDFNKGEIGGAKLELTRNDVKKIIEAAPGVKDGGENGDGNPLDNYGDIRYEGYETVLSRAVDAYAGDNNLAGLRNDFYGNNHDAWLKALSATTGYDSAYTKTPGGYTHYVAWAPNQVKSIYNNGNFSTEDNNIYHQQQNQQAPKGAFSLTENGQRLINLFEKADQSTFVHEMAHLYLQELQRLSAAAPAGNRASEDYKKLMAWAAWSEKQVEDYKGTSSAAEFYARDAAIKAAIKAGDTAKAEELKGVWAQERFARGFEEYLRSGEAPATGLRKAFRQFKKWLTKIYKDVIGAGAKATPEVEAIMARMVATDEEIETITAANKIKDLQKIDPDILESDTGKMLARWKEEAKERAKEKLLKTLLADYTRDVENKAKEHEAEFRKDVTETLQSFPCFAAEEMIKQGMSKEEAALAAGYKDVTEYETDLRREGGSIEQAITNYVGEEMRRFRSQMPSYDQIYEKAQEAVAGTEYQDKLSVLEAEILQRRKDKYNAAPGKIGKAMGMVEDARKAGNVEKLEQAVKELKYALRWKDAEYKLIVELESKAAKVKQQEKDKAAMDKAAAEFDRQFQILKDSTVRNKNWMRGVRDATEGKVKAIREFAKDQLANLPISQAANPMMWHRKELQASKDTLKALAAAQRKNSGVDIKLNFDEQNVSTDTTGSGREDARAAYTAKINQATFAAMVAEAFRVKRELDKIVRHITRRQASLAAGNVKIDATHRFYHDHLLFAFGLRKNDAVMGPGTTITGFADLMNNLKESMDFAEDVPQWLVSAATGKDQVKDYRELTMQELKELNTFCDILYTTGRNANMLLTLDKSIDDVAAECSEAWNNTVVYHTVERKYHDTKGAMGEYMGGIIKPELLLQWLGGKNGPYIKYIYQILFTGLEKEEIAQEKEAGDIKALYDKFFTAKERREICEKDIGEDMDGEQLTKEHLLCMALNFGNTVNKARLVKGFGFNSEDDVKALFARYLTEKDWQFIQAMWDHVNEFYAPVNQVMEKSTGVSLHKVQAEAFTVTTAEGKVVNLAGGYYPIVYNTGKSVRAADFEQDAMGQSLGGASVFGVGMGSTKDRNASLNIKRPLLLQLDAANRHIRAQIHTANMRLACRDAYKVLNNAQVQQMIVNTYGAKVYMSLKAWTLNTWQPPITHESRAERTAARIRAKNVQAIMAYRVSTAFLNFANVWPMATELGPVNMVNAMYAFYSDFSKNKEFVMNASVFMRNRATNIDRDLRTQTEQLFKPDNKIMYQMEKYSDWLIESTDMFCSLPTYWWKFREVYNQELQKEGTTESKARETANFAALTAVRNVTGSSRSIDLTEIQRSKSEFIKLITPFFSYSITMMNSVWSKYYEDKYVGKQVSYKNADGSVTTELVEKNWKERYGRFAQAFLFNFVLMSATETAIRMVISSVSAAGPDKDKDDWFTRFMKEWAKNCEQNVAGGFYGINIPANAITAMLIDGKYSTYSRSNAIGVVTGAMERFTNAGTTVAKYMFDKNPKNKTDLIDVLRSLNKAANAGTGFSDTISDAMWNSARFLTDEYKWNNDDDLRQYIFRSMFDKELKSKASQKRH